jgi:hypothetical protein
MEHNRTKASALDDFGQSWLEVVRRHVESLRFGAVEIIVHDAHVIQIEKIERLRFSKSGAVQASESIKTEASAKTAPATKAQPQ